MNKQTQESLKQVSQRVNFSRVERKLYGHDVGAMPGLIAPLVGNAIPDAVVQPQSEAELAALLKWANANRIPVTPRGRATSGYGGVLPIKQGIVIDFYCMKDVIALDKDAQTVTVQPGMCWEALDKYLIQHGLTLRLYPSSYPSSTVGGWLAQGGAGFGSYEYGYLRQSILSARLVLPSGEVRMMTGDDLDLVSDAEGITGLVSQVTLRVQPHETLKIISAACNDEADFQKLIEELIASELPFWSLLFINPKMAEMKNQAPLPTHNGHEQGKRPALPKAYILTLTFRARDAKAIEAALPAIFANHHTEQLIDEIAQHEWDSRFKLMLVKRLSPSLIPSEVVVPLETLGIALKEINEKVRQPLVKEGVILRSGQNGKPEAVILGFIPSDQRTFKFNFVYALALTVIQTAEKHGGRAYSTGLYFSGKAESVLGKERFARLRDFKKQVDPNNILNPGKVVDGTAISAFLGMVETIEPLARPIGNAFSTDLGERIADGSVRGIPADVAWYAYACSQCGYCVDSCDQFYGRGWESQSSRGKWYWLREYLEGREKWSQEMVDTFLLCTTCEMCNLRCSTALPIEQSWMKMRGKLINEDKRMTFPPFEMMAEATRAEGDIWAGYRKNRADWFPEELRAKHGSGGQSKNVYFAGCTASYVEQDIGIGTAKLLDAAGVDYTYLGSEESCCGTPALVSGKWDLFTDIMQQNMAAVKRAGADTVIASCPACDMMWRHVYPQFCKKLEIDYNFKVRHYSEVVAEKIESGEFKFPAGMLPRQTVTWHDSCHLGRVSGVYDAPRTLIQAIPNVELKEMVYNREEAHCCGSVITLVREPTVAAVVGEIRLKEVQDTGADKVLALCPCCQFQFRVTANAKQIPIQVVDLSRFAAEALGFNLPDPNPEVKAQWAVFEAMIALMTPAGFANLMGTMWPELLDAMPLGMGGMMRFMGKKAPFMLSVMKPMFPILFPILLPGMMPKVMDTMLSRVADRIPMPDYMAEQMPSLMPKVMDSLMPHMIHDLVPLATGPMILHLTGKN